MNWVYAEEVIYIQIWKKFCVGGLHQKLYFKINLDYIRPFTLHEIRVSFLKSDCLQELGT
jgi:hypothetical protein